MAENFFGITDVGRQRQNNEDAFIAQRVLNDDYIMACVIDGVGGYEGGEIAAAVAKQSILDYFKIPSGDTITMMKEAIIAANQKIQQEKQKNTQYGSMACVLTLALVDIKNKQFSYAHVGDTRLYLLRDGSLVKLTKDHSFVGFLEDSGKLSEEAAMNHPKRNEINKALGFDVTIGINTDYIETGTSPFLPGDIILLCSDGLTDLVSNREITSILASDKTLEEKGRLLVDAANEKGGKDNITVVIVHNNSKPVKQRAAKPVVVKKNDTEANEFIGSEPIKMQVGPEKKKNKSNTIIFILSFLFLVLLSAFLWSLFRDKEEKIEPADTVIPVQQSGEARQLNDSLQFAKNVEIIIPDSTVKQPIIVRDTIAIGRDSLHLIGHGDIVLRADSSYTGPAFLLSGNCRFVLLENMTLENFKVGIATKTTALRLKNIRFKNCLVPIQHELVLSDSLPVSGSLKDKSFYSDTTIQTTTRK